MNEKDLHSIVIYSDGACSGNPGPGGWGAIVVTPEGQVQELGGREAPTTNNRMEMTAVLEALRLVKDTDHDIRIFTDSTYVIRGVTQWMWGWRKRGWKTAEGNEVSNRDLWESFMRVLGAMKNGKEKAPDIQWNYVRGHRGNPGNERCDEIAVAFSQGRSAGLYRGSLLKYSVDVFEFPESEGLPEMKPKTEKKVAYSYLSEVGGITVRHKTWADCERRVKGRSGAKFKKSMSADEEKEILASWSVNPTSVKEE